MIRKFFAQDRNYLLEEAQLRLQDRLLTELLEKAKTSYEQINNPLGLNDSFSRKISAYNPSSLITLHGFYRSLAGIYRYKFGENQLGFLWDGKDYIEKYVEEWSAVFLDWTSLLCRRRNFVQAVLDLTVFFPGHRQAHLTETRMNAVMLDLFEIKIDKQKGIVEMKVA